MANGPVNFEITGLDLTDPGEMTPSVDVVVNSDGVTTDVFVRGEKVVRVNVFVIGGKIVAEMIVGESGAEERSASMTYDMILDGIIPGTNTAEPNSFDDPGVKVA